MNVLGSSQIQSQMSSNNILENINENQVQEMKRVTDEYRLTMRNNQNIDLQTEVNMTDSNYYDSINITDENLDTILDCPEEEEYESQKKYGKMFLNSSYSRSKRRKSLSKLIVRFQKRFEFQQIPSRSLCRK